MSKIISLEKDGKLRIITSLSREQRLELCEGIARRHLLVAMLQMRHGEEFRNIIRSEFERVPSASARRAYGLVCQFHALGLAIPERALLDVVGINTGADLTVFDDAIADLMLVDESAFYARHEVIARAVARHAFSTSASRRAAILEVLKALVPSERLERDLFQQLFAKYGMYRRLAIVFGRDLSAVRDFYGAVRSSLNRWPLEYWKYVASSEGMNMSFLGEVDRARECFVEATKADPQYEFPVRQHAWLELHQGQWDKAARLAEQAAAIAPQSFETLFQCARILSLNTLQNFRRAKQYFQRALDLVPDHKECLDRWEQYCDAEITADAVSSLAQQDVLPQYVLKILRPGLRFVRALFGPNDPRFRTRLRAKLQGMSEEVGGDIGDLYDVLGGINPKNDIDKALVNCNLGRLLYLEWYHKGEPHDPERMEEAFKTSLVLNAKDPFAHCWYGTFLKEVRRDMVGAKREYDAAIRLGNGSQEPRHVQHPLFLNNLALLALDQIQLGELPPARLAAVHDSLKIACRRVDELQSDFDWPAKTLDLCEALMREYGVLSPDAPKVS